jgi:hypothetical protein
MGGRSRTSRAFVACQVVIWSASECRRRWTPTPPPAIDLDLDVDGSDLEIDTESPVAPRADRVVSRSAAPF